jgi:succinoglycan biosynthesis transport protein ExoP
VAPPSAASIELAQLDAQISQASANLGPNHPQMLAMKARRAVVAQVATQDAAAQRSAQVAAAGAGAGALNRLVEDATHKVIANRDKIERLNQLQAEVNLRREQYSRSMERIAVLRKEAEVADTGISSLGESVTPQKPKWPNIPLVIGGAFGLGLALGVLLSVIVELFARRVRGPEDLASVLDIPMLAFIATQPTGRRDRVKGGRPAIRLPGRRRPVQA